ncbi:MAG: Trk system potassium transporter TrkA, partial [Sporomusaceae bacterium]|nr:Trk system potassium transporter TrkA [Sporomusaceae bacterium]
NEAKLAAAQTNLDVMTVIGNGAVPRVLRRAGISTCDIFIAVTDYDEVNMVACLAAKQAGVQRTIARVRDEGYSTDNLGGFYQALGVDLTINPEMVTAVEINNILKTPGALDIERFADGKVQMFEAKIREGSPYAQIPLAQLSLPPQILVAGIMRTGKMIIPNGKDVLMPHDFVFFVGADEAINAFGNEFNLKKTKVQRVLIIGAGRIGRNLAALLKEAGISVKLIEKDKERSQKAADELEGSMVFCADGADLDVLNEVGIAEADAVVCLTEDDKLNILIALLAKHLGVTRTFIRLENIAYRPISENIGVDVALSARLLTTGAILRLTRPGDVAYVAVLQGAAAEAMEIIVKENFHYLGVPLKDAKFPKNALLGAIVRQDGAVVIPKGNTAFAPQDRVVVFVLPESAAAVVKYFERS